MKEAIKVGTLKEKAKVWMAQGRVTHESWGKGKDKIKGLEN